MTQTASQPLFSYGTLQLSGVQIETFGRLLDGRKQALLGWTLEQVKITDPEVLRKSGQIYHPILRRDKSAKAKVAGTVFLITDAELARADAYEVDDYVRVKAALVSGGWAWVYVAKDDAA